MYVRAVHWRWAVVLGAVVCSMVAGALAPALSCAAPAAPVGALTLHLGGFELAVREVDVVVGELPAEAATLVVRKNAAEATRVAVPYAATTLHVPLGIEGESARVGVEALDAAGAVIAASSADLTIDTIRFIPAYPRVSVYWESFVTPSQSIRLRTLRAVSVSAALGGRGCTARSSAPGSSWVLRVPDAVPFGRTRLRVYVRNAWGVRALTVPLWSLRWKPSAAHALLVDKSDFTLYYAQGYRMHKVYPVAIGMPGTPTHVGSFWLGSPRSAGGAWGVLRMALSKHKGTGALSAWGGYYIHGTNQPDSIGTEASHGCVRMYNSGVRDLSRHTRNHLTSVTIRP